LTRRIKTSQIQILLTIVAIVAMLSWGLFAVLWTFPNDQGSIVNAVFNGENGAAAFVGNGNGSIIKPSSEAQYIMFYQTVIPVSMGSGTYNVPGGQGFAYGPFLWTTLSSTASSYEERYLIFTFEFSSQLGPGPLLWFTGPQGNLTASLYTNKYGGINSPRPFGGFQTDIIPASGPGNYTMHYRNNGPGNLTGIVSMGPSSVVFTRPYLYAGSTTISLAAAFSIVTGLVFRKRVPAGNSRV
jgi:hypothetical protein